MPFGESLVKLLQDPLFNLGIGLLSSPPEETFGQALGRGQKGGLESLQFQNQVQNQKELQRYRKEKSDLLNQQTKEKKEQVETLKKLFGNTKLDPTGLADQLMKTGLPDLISLGIKIKPEEPKLQTFPVGNERVTGYFNPSVPPSKESFNRVFGAPRSIANQNQNVRAPRRLTRDELLAKELQGVDLASMTEEQRNAKLAEIGQKTGRLDLLKKEVKTKGKERISPSSSSLNSDLVLYNKIGKDEYGTPKLSEREFIAKSEVLRGAEKAAGREISDLERIKFLTGTPEEFESILKSLNTEVKPQPVTLEGGLKTLSPEQQNKLKVILDDPNISPEKKREVLFKLNIK